MVSCGIPCLVDLYTLNYSCTQKKWYQSEFHSRGKMFFIFEENKNEKKKRIKKRNRGKVYLRMIKTEEYAVSLKKLCWHNEQLNKGVKSLTGFRLLNELVKQE